MASVIQSGEGSPKAAHRPYQGGLVIAVILGLVLVPAILIAATWEIAHEFQLSAQLRDAVNRSFEENAQNQLVFSLLQDSEAGQRGYIITGQAGYLEPLQRAQRELGPGMAKLEALQQNGLITYPGKPALMKQFKALAQRRLNGALNAVKIRDAKGAAAAEAFILTGRGKAVMDQIRAIVARMDVEEHKAVDARVAQQTASSNRAEAVIIAMFVALALLLAAAYGLVLRQAHGRQKLLLQAQTAAARQTAIFENAQDAMVIFNPSGTIESINRAGEVLFGRDRTALVRRDMSLLLDLPSDARLFLERLGAGADLKAGVASEFTARRADGEAFPVEATLGLITLPEGDRVVVAVRDISERRRMETMKAEFVSTVSHELRTPLTSIAGSLGLLIGGAAGTLPDRAGRLLGIAHSNCQRLVRLINDILDIEKLESGKMRFDMAPQDLADLARKGVDAIAGMALTTGVKVTLDAAEGFAPIVGDPDRLAQVIANLLSNAVKFSPAEGLVEVTVAALSTGRVQLAVHDHGPGVPAEFRSRMFSKFAQADSSDTRQKGGTGLGLAISKEIVERHGGRLTFDSIAGEGATFVIDLPAVAQASVLTSSLDGPARPGPNARVLLCEDDADIAEVIGETLRRDGLEVDVVGSLGGAQAALAPGHGYAALLLDIRLPDGNGLDLLNRLRRNPATRALPVMIVSAEAGAGHALDVIDWMQKPVDGDRLRAALAAAIAPDGARQTRVLHVEDDSDVRQIVADALAGHCSVIGVEGLTAARKALELTTPDLVILDIGLAEGSGIDLLPELKRPDGARIPIVIFSAQTFGEDEADSLARSVDAVLTKSKMSLDQLSDTVRTLARSRETRVLS